MRRERPEDDRTASGGSAGESDDNADSELLLYEVAEAYERLGSLPGRACLAVDEDWRQRIDEVPRELVGCVRVGALAPFAPGWARKALALVLAEGSGHQPPVFNTPERVHEIIAKRRAARVPVRGKEAEAVAHLAATSGLFRRAGNGTRASATAGAFFVEKASNKKLRVIVDARAGNAHMSTEGHVFELFGLESLINVLSFLAANETWYAINIDFRHWFHQLRLDNDHIRSHFVIPVVSQGRSMGFEPVATPMGWILAPLVGQTTTWSILLASGDKNGVDLPHHSGVDMDYLRSLTHMPPWLPLRGGGGIFVVLDNVLVVTADIEIARYWQRRIETQVRRFGARLKGQEPTEPAHVERHTLTRNGATTIDFMGMLIGHHTRQIKMDASETLRGLDGSGVWRGTFRDLASNIGKLVWFFRVYSVAMYSPEMRELRELYRRMTPPDSQWDLPADLSASLTDALRRYWDMRAAAPPKESAPLDPIREPCFAAADASRSHLGVVVFDRDGAAHQRTEINDEREHYIGVGELAAILLAVVSMFETFPSSTLAILATDSLNAKSWVERGYANNQRANELLAQLFRVLGQRRLYLVYVPTNDNLADRPSRCETGTDCEEYRNRHAATWNALQHGGKEALGMWRLCGGAAGGQTLRRVYPPPLVGACARQVWMKNACAHTQPSAPPHDDDQRSRGCLAACGAQWAGRAASARCSGGSGDGRPGARAANGGADDFAVAPSRQRGTAASADRNGAPPLRRRRAVPVHGTGQLDQGPQRHGEGRRPVPVATTTVRSACGLSRAAAPRAVGRRHVAAASRVCARLVRPARATHAGMRTRRRPRPRRHHADRRGLRPRPGDDGGAHRRRAATARRRTPRAVRREGAHPRLDAAHVRARAGGVRGGPGPQRRRRERPRERRAMRRFRKRFALRRGAGSWPGVRAQRARVRRATAAPSPRRAGWW